MSSKPQVLLRSVDELIAKINELPAMPQIIAIDGVTSAGKSTLGELLAERLQGEHLDVDDHIEPLRGVYVEALRVAQFRQAISSGPMPKILSGICMLAVAEKVADGGWFHIYLKRITATGWIDGEEMYGTLLDTIAASEGRPPSAYKPNFEVREYHRVHRPDERADVIFERTE